MFDGSYCEQRGLNSPVACGSGTESMSGLASGTEQNLLNGCAKNGEYTADRLLPAAQLVQLMMGMWELFICAKNAVL